MKPVIDSIPYVSLLPDGRSMLVHLPADEVDYDENGEMLFKYAAIMRLEQARVLCVPFTEAATRGHRKVLCEVLGIDPDGEESVEELERRRQESADICVLDPLRKAS
jgi:hypothetical protein